MTVLEMSFYRKPRTIKDIDHKIITDLFFFITNANKETPPLIKPGCRSAYDNMVKLHQTNENKENIVGICELLLPMLNDKNDLDVKFGDFINLLIVRVKEYHQINKPSHYESQRIVQQYNQFFTVISSCLKNNANQVQPTIDNYFSPRTYHTVVQPYDKNNSRPSTDYLELSKRSKIMAYSALGIGISLIVLGASSIVFCLPLGITALAVGALVTAIAALYLKAPKLPNTESVQNKERAVFDAALKLHQPLDNGISKNASEENSRPNLMGSR